MKSSFIYSVFKAKCPVCHSGDVFNNKGVYDIRNMDKMHSNCKSCGFKYEKEKGFWYGAMFVSYAMTVSMSIASFILTYLIYPQANAILYIGIIIAVIFIMAPVTFRGSRLLWMNFFAKFDPKKHKMYEQV